MNSILDALPGLMTLYICVGIIVCTSLAIYYIHKDQFDQHRFPFCLEMILCYGPIGMILIYWELKKLVKYLWARDYRAWYNRHKENFQAWNKSRKKLKKQMKDFKAKQK